MEKSRRPIGYSSNMYPESPVEGLELFWMGKLMKGLDKGYNAQEFFKAAYTTRYDLGPAISADLQRELEE